MLSTYNIDRFSFFQGKVFIRGWIFIQGAKMRNAYLRISGIRLAEFSINLPSQDVENVHGSLGINSRIELIADAHLFSHLDLCQAKIEVITDTLGDMLIENIGLPFGDPVQAMYEEFLSVIKTAWPSGNLLEVGSRSRSGNSRKCFTPSSWEYTGFDYIEGDNVDVVGDAHNISRYFPANRFHAVKSFSVLEHLIMPWKFVVELNKVMVKDGIGLFLTHQCWPIHDSPWDFWRFSDQSWHGLLNRHTGFEIIKTQLGEPAYIVPNKLHPATCFGEANGGFLSSGVMFRKVSDTSLEWPVEPSSILNTVYPV